MAATALIKFDQGPNTDVAGRAVLGTLASVDGSVSVSNADNTDVASWFVYLLYAPPDSATYPGPFPMLLASAVSSTPAATFDPDVPGTYRTMMDVISSGGVRNRDIRCFGVRNSRGVLPPPHQKNPDPLPIELPAAIVAIVPQPKPDEQNYGGQVFGWAGDRNSGQLGEFFMTYDDVAVKTVTATPFVPALTHEEPCAFIDLATIGADAVVNLPAGARAGQRFRIIAGHTSSTYKVTVNPSGAGSISALSSVVMKAGSAADFAHLGSDVWVCIYGKVGVNDLTLVGSTTSNDTTGWVAVGGGVLNPTVHPNVARTTFKAMIETTDAAHTAEVRLYNVSDAVEVTKLTTVSTLPQEVTAVVSLPATLKTYEVQLRLATSSGAQVATCKNAKITLEWLQP